VAREASHLPSRPGGAPRIGVNPHFRRRVWGQPAGSGRLGRRLPHGAGQAAAASLRGASRVCVLMNHPPGVMPSRWSRALLMDTAAQPLRRRVRWRRLSRQPRRTSWSSSGALGILVV